MQDKSMSESLAKGIAKQVIDSIKVRPGYSELSHLEGLSHRRCMKLFKRECKRSDSKCVFLGEKFPESSKWIVVSGEWSASLAKPSAQQLIDNVEKYNELGFDLTINNRKGLHYKFLYVVLTQHALERGILRSGEWLNTAAKIRSFMNSYIDPLIRFALTLVEEQPNEHEIKDSVVIGEFFFAVVLLKGVNKFNTTARALKIITIMPSTYKSAGGALSIEDDERIRKNIIQYWPVLQSVFKLEI